MKQKGYVFLLLFALSGVNKESFAQADSRQAKVGEKLLNMGADSLDPAVSLRGLESLWYRTGDGRCFKAIQHRIDGKITQFGSIAIDKADPYYVDLIGRNILLLYSVTNQEKYYKAATALLQRFKEQAPSFAASFAAEYAAMFHEPAMFHDVVRQFVAHSDDMQRALYGPALIDALDFFPADQPGRDSLLTLLRTYTDFTLKGQDPNTGLWSAGSRGNETRDKEPDALASSLSVYALAKGVRLGYLPASNLSVAKKGICRHAEKICQCRWRFSGKQFHGAIE